MAGKGRHIAVVAPPLAGHYRPLGVLARRLAARGHRVTFVHMPDAAYAAPGGAGFHGVGATRFGPGALAAYGRRLARAGWPLGLPAMIRANAAISAVLLDELPDAFRAIGVDAVIAESAEPAGALAARACGLPFVTSHTGLPLNRERGVPPPFVGWRYRPGERGAQWNEGGYRVADRLMRPTTRVVAAAAARWGVDPTAHDGMSPLLQVAQCVRGLDFPRAELPSCFRYCGPFRGPAEPAPALPEDRPLVFCSLGSLQGDRVRAFAAMARACADLGLRAVVGHGGLLRERDARRIGHGALVRNFWPQEAVLARSAAAVLHGGFNTVADALAAGVPMVVAPIAFEQPATAARVAHAGAGRVLKGRATARRLRRELARVLDDPAYAKAAGRLAEETLAAGGADYAAELIAEAFATGRTPAF